MNKDELIARLVTYAEKLGTSPLTRAQVEDWIFEGLIPKAKAKGVSRGKNPEWEFGEQAFFWGQKIIELKSRRIKRRSAQRYFLFLMGRDFELSDLRKSLCAEIKRSVKNLVAGKEPPGDYEYGIPERSNSLHYEAKRLGPLDSRFLAAGFKLPEATLVQLASDFFYGNHGGSEKIVRKIIFDIFGLDVPDIELPKFDGLLGNPDEIENAGIKIIEGASYEELIAAREFFNSLLAIFQDIAPALELAGAKFNESTETGFQTAAKALELEFRLVSLFPIFIEMVRCLKKAHPQLQEMSLKITPELIQKIKENSAANTGTKPVN